MFVCVCVCVSVCVCMFVYVCVCVYVCMYVYVCARVLGGGGGGAQNRFHSSYVQNYNKYILFTVSNVLVNCCKDQANKYVVYGYLNSKMSPDAYLEKLTDYKDEEMRINYIGVRVL